MKLIDNGAHPIQATRVALAMFIQPGAPFITICRPTKISARAITERIADQAPPDRHLKDAVFQSVTIGDCRLILGDCPKVDTGTTAVQSDMCFPANAKIGDVYRSKI